MLDLFSPLFTYDDWANREAATSVARAAAAPLKARKVLAHIFGTEWLWYARIAGGTAKMAVWPELTPEQCAAESSRLLETWQAFLGSAGEAGMARPVAYKNSKGEPWNSSVGDILMHIVMHSAYHRGQIATLLRDSGGEPAYTDYIHAVRTGRAQSIFR
jgi:uncharacterized damage-inducible protein DinB